MATNYLDILIEQKLANGDINVMFPATRMENVIVNRPEITLDANWTGSSAPYTKTVTISGVTTDNIVRIYPLWSDDLETRKKEREEYSKISKVDSRAGGILITCDEDKPEMALKIRVEVL